MTWNDANRVAQDRGEWRKFVDALRAVCLTEGPRG